jgi:hypothetical protein
MRKTKQKMTLDKVDQPKPAYVMPEPNDDIAAFGWDLGKLRYPSESSKKGDVWPGASMFELPFSRELQQAYGFDITFVPAKYVQIMLDNDPEVRAGAEKVKAARYSQTALDEYRKTIIKAFQERVVPDMLERFKTVAGHVAGFYAARLAHITKFGVEE